MTIHNEKQLIKQINHLSLMLGGEIEHTSTTSSTGRQSKKIVIEYDVTEKSK